MIEVLNNSIVWWHWVALGLILVFTEMATGTFISLGLGIAAILVGMIDLIVPIGLLYQLAVWILLSLLCVWLLFKKFKKAPTILESGQSGFRLDTQGNVTKPISPHQRGKVLFDAPVLGNTIWHATSDDALAVGTRIKIVEINGQLIKVAPLNH